MTQNTISGKALIFSAPSGAGKSTIVGHIMQKFPNLAFSVSATTRAPRGNEQNGIEYFFISHEDFRQKIQEDAFVEWEEVYGNQYYGTLKSELNRMWQAGKTAVFDIDVKGGINLKKKFGEGARSVFIAPPSLEILRERLVKRGTDSPEAIEKRVAKASIECGYREQFDCCIVNDHLEDSLSRAEEIVREFLL